MVEYHRLFNVITVRRFLVAVILITMLVPMKLLAEQSSVPEEKATISQVLLATGTRYSPYVDPRLPGGGWSVSVISAVFKQVNMTTRLEEFPWSRVLANTKIKVHDGAFPFVATEKRRNDFYYSDPINYVPIKIIANKNVNASTVAALKNYTFCLPYGYSSATEFLTVLTPKNTTHAPSTRDCLNKVTNGWADIALLNQYSEILHEKRYAQLKLLPISVQKEPLHFIVAKSHPQGKALITLFNQGLSAIKQNQLLDEINKQYELLLTTPLN